MGPVGEKSGPFQRNKSYEPDNLTRNRRGEALPEKF